MSESKHTSDQLIGWGDHSCLFVRPQGLGTNGGCRCAREPGRLAHNVRVLRRQRDELLAALKAQEEAEAFRANECDECRFDSALCEQCSERFGRAIELRRAAIARAEGRSDE